MKILYEDNHLLVVDKKAGLPMQPSQSSFEDLESEAKIFIKKRDDKPGGVFLHAVHRIDKPVSGIALFAKTQKALQRLNEAIRNVFIKKTYFAVVEGLLKKSGTLEHYLRHGDFKAEVSSKEMDGFKKAILRFKCLKHFDNYSMLEIDLVSGRYHQIRAQFGAILHPIVFDSKYGSRMTGDYEGILLHHGKMEFPHPVKDEIIVVESSIPLQWKDLIQE